MEKPKRIKHFFGRRRLFVIGVFVFAVVVHLPYLAPGGPSACYPNPLFLVIDEGTALYDSFRITCGEVMYRDFFQFQGPVFYHIYAGLFAVTGPSIAAARGLNLIITAFTAVFIALLVAQMLGPVAGIAAAAVHACLLVPMYPYVYPHWLAEAFAFAGIYLLATSGTHVSRELAGGVCLGLCSATIQSLGLTVLVASMLGLAIPGILRRNLRETYPHLLVVFGGVLLSVSPFLIYLGAVNALDRMWYGMVDWVLNHYSFGQMDAMREGYGAYLGTFLALHKTIGQPWRSLAMVGLQIVKFLPVLTVLGVMVATTQTIIESRRREIDYASLIISIGGFAATIPLLAGITRPDLVHIAFLGSFGLCGAAVALESLVNWKPRFRLPVTIAWVAIAVLMIANFSAKTVMTYQPSREMKGWRDRILKQGMASWIDNNLDSNERIVTAYGGLQYLYIRRAAISFTFLPFGTPLYYSDEQWREIGGQILKTLPPIVEVTRGQWLQVTQRTPKLRQLYRLVNNRFLIREGFTPLKQLKEKAP